MKKDEKYYFHQYIIEQNILESLHLNERLFNEDNLEKLIESIDIHFVLQKLGLQLTLLSLNGKTIRNYDDCMESIKAMKSLLNIPKYAKHPLISTCVTAINLVKTMVEIAAAEQKVTTMKTSTEKATKKEELVVKALAAKASCNKLLKLLDKNTTVITQRDLSAFYVVATNFYAAEIAAGRLGYQGYFNLFKTMDEKDAMLEDDFMPAIKWKNAINAACRVDEIDWAVKAIQKYKPYVNESVRESVYHFNMGVVASYQENHDEVSEYLKKYGHEKLIINVNHRVYGLKTRYDRDGIYNEKTMTAFESALSYFQTTKKLSDADKRTYKNFMYILIKLYEIKYGNMPREEQKQELKNCEEKLNNQTINADRAWLNEKIEELKEELAI